MLFTTYGNRNNPAVLLMHGMCQDWHSMYYFLHDLEAVYYLIVPGMDGFYDGSGEFTTFEDQCRQIEDYVNKKPWRRPPWPLRQNPEADSPASKEASASARRDGAEASLFFSRRASPRYIKNRRMGRALLMRKAAAKEISVVSSISSPP